MDNKTYKCCSCGTEAIGPDTGNLGDIIKATGFKMFFDCSNGLQSVHICPSCVEKAKPHIEALFEILGGRKHIHWPNLLRLAGIERSKH